MGNCKISIKFTFILYLYMICRVQIETKDIPVTFLVKTFTVSWSIDQKTRDCSQCKTDKSCRLHLAKNENKNRTSPDKNGEVVKSIQCR